MGELRRNLAEVVKKRISVTYPIGGWKLIYERLTDKINNNNGEILTNHEVKEVIINNKQGIGVKCGDKIFSGEKISSNSFSVYNPFSRRIALIVLFFAIASFAISEALS